MSETPETFGMNLGTLREELESLRTELAAQTRALADAEEKVRTLEADVAFRQAKIDSLMLEYCPEDMTLEQIEEWGRNQVKVSPEKEAEIKAALAATQPVAESTTGATGWVKLP